MPGIMATPVEDLQGLMGKRWKSGEVVEEVEERGGGGRGEGAGRWWRSREVISGTGVKWRRWI